MEHIDSSMSTDESVSLKCERVVQGRNLMTMPISEASREEILDSIKRFLSPMNKFKVRTAIRGSSKKC